MGTQKNTQNVIVEIIDKVNKYGGMQRLGCVFNTEHQCYFYDSGTGKVENLNESEAQFFNWLFQRNAEDGYEQWLIYNQGDEAGETLAGIQQTIEKEHLLEAPYPSHMYSALHQEKLEETLQKNIKMITLELTGRCNLRCGYCIYNEGFCENRNFSQNDMSEETAKKALDFFAQHSEEDVIVTFYGGEPLLKFPLIKKCVQYAQEIMPDKKISYSITSNMTLMTKEMAEFFYSIKNFGLVASLDGPEEIHNAYRKYPNGEGSFQYTMRGLKTLAEVFGDDLKERLSVSTVFAPPYTYEHLDKVNQFFDSLDWFPKEIQKLISYPENGSVEYTLEETEGVDLTEEGDKVYINTINKWTKDRCERRNLSSKELVTYKFYNDILFKIHKRVLTQEATELFGLNGCCVPGAKRLYVTTEGEFKPCDRIGVCPNIGNVDQGMDFDAIRKLYIDDYIEASEECGKCWAKSMCAVCYAKIYSAEKISDEKKKYACDMARHTTKQGLILYHAQLERDPESLRYLNDIQYG